MKKFLLTSTAVLTLASAASAGNFNPVVVDPPVLAATAPAAVDWSGFYAGGLASFDGGTLGYAATPGGVPFNQYSYISSTSYGAFVGYNVQRGKMVFGGEAAYNDGGVAYPGFPTELTTYAVDLKGRIGFTAGKALIYGVLGYSMTGWTTAASYDADGLSYGAGVDYMVGDHLFVGAEYLARDMRALRGGTGPTEGHSELQSAALRVGWKF